MNARRHDQRGMSFSPAVAFAQRMSCMISSSALASARDAVFRFRLPCDDILRPEQAWLRG